MEPKAIIEKVGKDVVFAAHQHFIEGHLDNAEYIPALRKSIQAVGKTAGEFVGAEAGAAVTSELTRYARELFVELWLRLAEEDVDGKGAAREKKAALSTFDEIYSSESPPL
jgi:hypothetical protein